MYKRQSIKREKNCNSQFNYDGSYQAQRAVDFIAGGTFAIDGHQERVGESIFLSAPSCVNVTSSSPEEASPSSVSTENTTPQYSLGKNTTPEPAWGNSKLSAYS